MRFALLPLCAVLLQGAQESHPELPAAVRPVVALARSSAPEFFADAIVRLVETGRIANRDLQVDLLTEAFGAAGNAHQPVKLVAMPGTPGATAAADQNSAGELNLDAMSLRARILKALVTVDRAKAMELFASLTPPALKARSCEDPLIADASAYYEAAGVLAQSVFPKEEKEQGRHAQFMLTALSAAQSPNELAAFARALQSAEWTREQWELLLSALGAAMESVRNDYRPFAFSIESLQAQVDGLTQIAESYNVDSEPLLRGFRQYLVSQMSAPRCAEETEDGAAAVKWFNSAVRGSLAGITEQETNPMERREGAHFERYFQGEEPTRLMDDFVRRKDAQGATVAIEGFMSGLAAWSPAGSEIDAFHQKATLLFGLIQRVPAGQDRDRVVDLCVALLRSSGVKQQDPVAWLVEVKRLTDSAGLEAPKILQVFRASGDQALQLYAAVH